MVTAIRKDARRRNARQQTTAGPNPYRLEALERRQLLSAAWTTVDEIPGAIVRDLATDSDGNLYAVGDTQATASSAVLRKWDAATGTWSPTNTWQLASGFAASYQAVFVASNSVTGDETLYVAGAASDGRNSSWIVRASHDGGQTWITDTYALTKGQPTAANDLAVDANGNVFVVGSGLTKNGKENWIVRKYDADLRPLSTFVYGGQNGAHARAIAVAGSSIYVTGFATGKVNTWVTQRSTDGGATWTNSDSFNLQPSMNAAAQDVAVDSAGRVFVVGTANSTNGLSGSTQPSYQSWVVRQLDASGTWKTIDLYQVPYSSKGSHQPNAIAIGSNGSIFVAGATRDANNVNRGIVRSSADGGATWTISDDYQKTPGFQSGYWAVATDSQGNVYAGGWGGVASGAYNWIIRELPAQSDVAPLSTSTTTSSRLSAFSRQPLSRLLKDQDSSFGAAANQALLA